MDCGVDKQKTNIRSDNNNQEIDTGKTISETTIESGVKDQIHDKSGTCFANMVSFFFFRIQMFVNKMLLPYLITLLRKQIVT